MENGFDNIGTSQLSVESLRRAMEHMRRHRDESVWSFYHNIEGEDEMDAIEKQTIKLRKENDNGGRGNQRSGDCGDIVYNDIGSLSRYGHWKADPSSATSFIYSATMETGQESHDEEW